MSLLHIRLAAGALAGALVASGLAPPMLTPSARRVLPGDAGDRRSWRSGQATLPAVNYVPFNSDAAHEWDTSFSWTKTITPGLSVVISDGPTWEHPGGYGWNGLDTELQWQALCLPDAEFMSRSASTYPGPEPGPEF